MTKNPNFPKFVLALIVLVVLFIGTMAITTAPHSSAQEKAQQAQAAPTVQPPPPSPPPAVDHVFEIEGNTTDDSAIGEDWNNINPANGQSRDGAFGSASRATFVNDENGAAETFFTGGSSKDFIDIEGNWQITTTSVPDKDEIDHAYAALYTDNTGVTCTSPGVPAGCNAVKGHRVLVFGGDRHATNGDSNIGFWFFQGNVSADVPNSVFHGVHRNGDLFIVSAFTKGGGTSTIDVYEWVGTPGAPGTTNLSRCNALGGVLDSSGDDTLCKVTSAGKGSAVVNPVGISLGWEYTAKGGAACNTGPCPAAAGAFYEGGIDLSALNLGEECFASFLVETRSSQSVDAVLKDFALGSFQQCGLECSKVSSAPDVCDGTASIYTYTAHNPGNIGITVTLIDDAETVSTADDIDVIASDAAGFDVLAGNSPMTTFIAAGGSVTYHRTKTLSVGSHHNKLTVHATNPSGITDCTSTADVTVHANPTVTVNSPAVCAGSSATITATPNPAGSYTYAWTVPAGVTNPGNVSSFSASVAGGYSVVITDGNSCSGSGGGTLTVNPNPTVTVNSATICDGSSTTITATPNPAGAYTYVWTVPAGATNPGNVASFSASVAGTYGVTITNANSCSGSNSGTLTVEANPTVSIAGDESCSTDETLVLTATVTGGSGTVTYSWTVPAGVVNPGNAPSVEATKPGNYAVHVTRGTASCPADAHLHVGLCAGASIPGTLSSIRR
ncbi:MAG TPA: hypothetical protein VF088_09330 [Pyrinomonadaceae bacterium]